MKDTDSDTVELDTEGYCYLACDPYDADDGIMTFETLAEAKACAATWAEEWQSSEYRDEFKAERIADIAIWHRVKTS